MPDIDRPVTIAPLSTADFSQIKNIEQHHLVNRWTDEALASELRVENEFHFGIHSTGNFRMLGFILSRLILDEVHIHHICIHPDERRRGLARSLLEHTLAAAWTGGAHKAFLEVASSNKAARDLYEKAGFTADFIRNKYYSNGDDAVMMSKTIQPRI